MSPLNEMKTQHTKYSSWKSKSTKICLLVGSGIFSMDHPKVDWTFMVVSNELSISIVPVSSCLMSWTLVGPKNAKDVSPSSFHTHKKNLKIQFKVIVVKTVCKWATEETKQHIPFHHTGYIVSYYRDSHILHHFMSCHNSY